MNTTTDTEPHDPRLLAWRIKTSINEIAAAKTPKEGAAIIRKKSRVVGGFPEGLAEQLMHQLAALSPHDYRQIEAAVAMALYGSSSKETRERLARRRIEFRDMSNIVEPGVWGEEPVDDLADDSNSPTGSNAPGRMLALAQGRWSFWNDTRTLLGMATIAPGVHMPLDSPRAEHALVQAWTDAKEKPLLPPVNTATRVINYLQAEAAREKTPKAESAVRVARGKSGAVLIDRGGEDHSAYSVAAAGVGVVDAATVEREEVRFIRLPHAQPFTEADLSASITDTVAGLQSLFKFVFVEDAWMLAGLILAAWVPDVAYSVVCIVGPQGSGKSSLTRECKNIADPENGGVESAEGKTPEDVFVIASKRHSITLDNMETLSPTLASTLCGIATGSQMTKRALYTNSDESAMKARANVFVNARNDTILRRPDILDRAAFVELARVGNSVSEVVQEARARAIRPRIVGGLLNAFAKIIDKIDTTKNPDDSRMAVAATVMRQLDEAFSPPISVDAAYRAARGRAAKATVGTNPFLLAVLHVVSTAPFSSDGLTREWKGTASRLLLEATAVQPYVWSGLRRDAPGWPGDATRASNILRDERETLGRFGVVVERDRKTSAREITISAPARIVDAYNLGIGGPKPVAPNAFPEEDEKI